MVWYFFGEDDWAARQAVTAIASEQRARVRWMDKGDLVDKSPVSLLGRGSSLFDRELLVMREVGSWAKSDQEDLLAALKKYPDSLCVIWEREKVDRRSKIYKTYAKQGREFAILGNQQLVSWLKEEAREYEGEIEDEAVKVLVDRIGGDRWRLKSELERLMLMGGVVGVKDVKDGVAVSEEAEVFGMLQALVAGQRQAAIRQVKILLDGGSNEFYILSMLAYQFRTLLTVRDGIDRGLSVNDIAGKGEMKPFAVQKSMEAAQKKSTAEWCENLRKVLATDFMIKQGKAESRTALMMLLISI